MSGAIRWPAFASTITFELFVRKQNEERNPQSFLQFVAGAISPFRTATPKQHCTYTFPKSHFNTMYALRADCLSILLDVRMRYQNKDMHLPACAKEGDHLPGRPEFCTYTAFQTRMRELIPDDWDAECKTTEDAPSDSARHW